MRSGRVPAFTLLVCTLALPASSKDRLFVTTSWAAGGEKVLSIDPESGETKTLWNTGFELDALVSPDGRHLYVNFIDIDSKEALVELDATTGALLRKVETPQVVRWIEPHRPGMAVSADGRSLYVLKTNYSAGSYDFFLMTFDSLEGRFLSLERAISRCPSLHILPLSAEGSATVLCGGGLVAPVADQGILRFSDLAHAELDPARRLAYVAATDGRIQAVNPATGEVIRTSQDAPLRHRRIRSSSGTMSPDGRLWYLPIKIPNNGEPWTEQIQVFDTQAMKTVSIITPCGPFWGLALSSDGRWLYASKPEMQNIAVIDTATHRTVRMLPVGARPAILLTAKAP